MSLNHGFDSGSFRRGGGSADAFDVGNLQLQLTFPIFSREGGVLVGQNDEGHVSNDSLTRLSERKLA